MPEYSILHLDDNPMFLEQMDVLMNFDSSIRYRAVQNPEDAKAELEKEMPDLLIVDLMLKNDWDAGNGADFAEEMYSSYRPNLKIMILSARSDEDIRRRLKKSIVHYATKDFRPSSFKKKLLEILNGKEMTNE